MTKKIFALMCMAAVILIASCDDDDDSSSQEYGTIEFHANGEGFVADGFISEDGWAISFDNVYVSIASPTAYQIVQNEEIKKRHAGHPHSNIPEGSAHATLEGNYFLDLKRNTGSIFTIGSVTNRPVGNYNYLNFSIKNISAGNEYTSLLNSGDTTDPSEYTGYSLIMIGDAQHIDTGTEINFTIKIAQEINFSNCGPLLDLDEDGIADGVLASGATASTQLTFHFDHIFGDYEEGTGSYPVDEEIMSYWGVGFNYFMNVAGLANDGGTYTMNITQEDMKSAANNALMNALYFQFTETMKTVGHAGEAHCTAH